MTGRMRTRAEIRDRGEQVERKRADGEKLPNVIHIEQSEKGADNNHGFRLRWMYIVDEKTKERFLELLVVPPPEHCLYPQQEAQISVRLVKERRPGDDECIYRDVETKKGKETIYAEISNDPPPRLETRFSGNWDEEGKDLLKDFTSSHAFIKIRGFKINGARQFHEYIVGGTLKLEGIELNLQLPYFGVQYGTLYDGPLFCYIPKTTIITWARPLPP